MIRYEITPAKLEQAIRKQSPKWLDTAKTRTNRFRKMKRYQEKSSIWSKIKLVYMTLQDGKCGYCERKFGADRESTIEHDVEHFRPKSAIKKWPPQTRSSLKYAFSTGDASKVGYYLLPYNIFNYIVACKKCNSTYKSDYFPICGSARMCASDDVRALRSEKPLLIYPLGDIDDDPEALITFDGLTPIPVAQSGHKRRRALVTIDFFKLAVGRDELLRERAQIIRSVYIAFYALRNEATPFLKEAAKQTIELALSSKSPHTNCARAFHALCKKNFASAGKYYREADRYLKTKGL
jgi:5-methylcytosine-specific restriction endonuclease McrA